MHASFEIAALFPCRVGEGKRAAISKQTCFSQKRVRSYIVLAQINLLILVPSLLGSAIEDEHILHVAMVGCYNLETANIWESVLLPTPLTLDILLHQN